MCGQEPHGPVDDRVLARQRPRDIDEALCWMRQALDCYHQPGENRRCDQRAVFMRLYYIMTLEVHAAINGCGAYSDQQIFIDPGWVRRLSGLFSSLYFESLEIAIGIGEGRDRDADWKPASQAWNIAYRQARDPRSTVVENALLGINAHINFDLPRALAANLTDEDMGSYRTMQIRKFDHDQVNNLLIRTLDPIQDVLAKDYEPGIDWADRVMGGLDEAMSRVALKYYRERVWWDALAYRAAAAQQGADDAEQAKANERLAIVKAKLDWESYKIALVVRDSRWLWRWERLFDRVAALVGKKRSARITLEKPGGVPIPAGVPINLAQPNPRRPRRLRKARPAAVAEPCPPLPAQAAPAK